MAKKTKKSEVSRYLPGDTVRFDRTEGGFLSLAIGREFHPRINAYRAFPLSLGDRYISLRDPDDNEIGILEDLDSLSGEAKALLVHELEARYFTPSITSVRSLKEEFGYTYWHVATDAGERRFTVQIGQNAVTHLGEGRIIVSDVEGNRFELEDYRRLDAKSLRVVEMLL